MSHPDLINAFRWAGVPGEYDACEFIIPFPNGVHVKVFPEDFTNPYHVCRAYIYHEKQMNLHFRKDCPGNRELDGEDLLALLLWASRLDPAEFGA